MTPKATAVGLAVTIALVGILSVAPAGTGSYHGGGGGDVLVRDPCPTDPAFNATDSLLADGQGQPAVHVDILDLEPYDPATLTIDAGTCVEWENHGDMTHTVDIVTRTSGVLASTHVGTLDPGEMAHHTFDEPGTYYLHCEINAVHEATMHQVIRVV